jgi:hypothetical protein
VDGEDGLQIWRVAANIFKKKENKEVGDSWQWVILQLGGGLGLGLTTLHVKKQFVTKYYAGLRNWTDSLERRKQKKCTWHLTDGM